MPFKILRVLPPKEIDKLTRLRAEKLSKKNAFEEQERLAALGQSSEIRGAREIQKEFKSQNMIDQKKRDQVLNMLEMHKKNPLKYNSILVEALQQFIYDEDISPRYSLRTEWDNTKLSLTLLPLNYAGGFKSSFIAKFDVLAAKMLAVRLGNTVARLEGYVSQTDSGIINADKEEARIIMENFKAKR